MDNKNLFTETLRDVAEIVRTSATPMTKEEILSYFKDINLTKEQEDMVYDYILHPVEEEIPEEAEEENPVTEEEKSEEDSKILGMYLEEIADIEEADEDARRILYLKLADGDTEVIKRISELWLKNVVMIARESTTLNTRLEDVIQEGNIALFLKLQEVCGMGNAENIENELTNAINIGIKQYIVKDSGEDDIENAVLGKVSLVDAAKKYLVEKNGSEPSIYDLSEYTKLSLEELDDVMRIMKLAEQEKK